MPVQRLYVYRCGATNVCALTAEKADSRLPAPLALDQWQFWMQISCDQTVAGLYGFALATAMDQIAAKGFYLFTGSIKLLDAPVVARSTTLPHAQEGNQPSEQRRLPLDGAS